ncbi:MAG TPA: AAA family ATPase [Candidatus Limnocylindria bacterium]|nr:AAA family ATPase [Candidatus Limnocylindria bacterium]
MPAAPRTPRLPEPELLERERELGELHDAIAAAQDGDGRLVFVEAGPGLGKTRLLAEASGTAQQGVTVLRARGAELEREFPFGGALQLFEGVVGRPDREHLLAGTAQLAEPLLRGGVPATPSAPGAGDFPLLHGLYWLVANLAERAPVVLVADDAHWLDASTLRFLAYLGQRLPDLAVALLVGARPGEPDGRGALLHELRGQQATRVVRPGPLSPAAVDRLVRDLGFPRTDPAFTAACAELTGGNPFLLRELLAALHEEGREATAAEIPRLRALAPEPVAQALELTLARLGDDATAFARSLAILGDGSRPEHVAELAGLDAEPAAAAAGKLARAGILRDADAPAFRHPMFRSAIEAELRAAERSVAHARAARLLARDGEPDQLVAAHLLATTPGSDPWVVEKLRSAAGAAMARGAPETAARKLERALAERPEPALRAELLLELAAAEGTAGMGDAQARFDEALALLDDPQRRAQALLLAGRLAYNRGEVATAGDRFERGLAEIGDGDDVLARELAAGLASVGMFEPQRGIVRLEAVIEDHDRPPTPTERSVLAQVALQRTVTGEMDAREALALALRAYDGGALLRDETADSVSLYLVTGVLLMADEPEEDIAICTAAIEDARRRGSPIGFAQATYCRAAPRHETAALSDAIADAEQALEMRRFGWGVYAPAAMAILAQAYLERGDVDAADAAINEPIDPRWEEGLAMAWVRTVRARIMLERGQVAAALEMLEPIDGMLGPLRNPALFPYPEVHARALLRAGDRDRAYEVAAEALERSRRFGAARSIGASLTTLGLVAGGDEGIAHLAEAVAVLEASPSILHRIHALAEYGAALRRAGRRQAAREPLRAALELASAHGARATADRAREELVAAGGRPRRERVSGPDALTPSERRVAEMAAAGMTNREIAEALFVTVKAVQFHLGNCFRKLDIAGRGELAAILEP